MRQTEGRLRALAEANLIGIVFSDADGSVSDANEAFLNMVGYTRAEFQSGRVRWTALTPPELLYLDERGHAEAKLKGSCTPYEKEYIRKDGSRVPVLIGYVLMGATDHVAFILDLTHLKSANMALREHSETLATINRVGQLVVAAELDLQKLVQTVTDAATEISGAQFGAFFYNHITETGESYLIYALSGVPRAAFDNIPMPRTTAIFGPTFRGEGTVRLDDVTQDPRYGKNLPYYGMPAGHLPVRSHLAVPVISRSGEVLGGLFLAMPRLEFLASRPRARWKRWRPKPRLPWIMRACSRPSNSNRSRRATANNGIASSPNLFRKWCGPRCRMAPWITLTSAGLTTRASP